MESHQLRRNSFYTSTHCSTAVLLLFVVAGYLFISPFFLTWAFWCEDDDQTSELNLHVVRSL